MNKFIIVDGSSMLVTSYYGMLPKQILFAKTQEEKEKFYPKIMQHEGHYTNAMYTMMRTLQKIQKEQKPTHMLICFDTTRDTFRREMYADYKGNRSETPAPLKQQFVDMENMLMEMGYAVEMSDTYEADDLAGSAAALYEKQQPTYIITKDHDYLQLVSDYTRLWLIQTKQETADEIMNRYGSLYGYQKEKMSLPDKAVEVTPAICHSEYEVWPQQIPDLKGIVGDTSDNIPGIKGVSSAAAPLLEEYKTLEEIYATIDSYETDKDRKQLSAFWKEELNIKRSPLKAMLEHREEGLLSKKLATIRRDVPLTHTFEEMSLTLIDEKKREEQLLKYGFKSLL